MPLFPSIHENKKAGSPLRQPGFLWDSPRANPSIPPRSVAFRPTLADGLAFSLGRFKQCELVFRSRNFLCASQSFLLNYLFNTGPTQQTPSKLPGRIPLQLQIAANLLEENKCCQLRRIGRLLRDEKSIFRQVFKFHASNQ